METKGFEIEGIKWSDRDDLILKNSLIKSIPSCLYDKVMSGVRPRECVLLGTYTRLDIRLMALREFESESFFKNLLKLKKKTAVYTKSFYNILATFELSGYLFELNSVRRKKLDSAKENVCSMLNSGLYSKYFDTLHLRVMVENRGRSVILERCILGSLLKRSCRWLLQAEIDDLEAARKKKEDEEKEKQIRLKKIKKVSDSVPLIVEKTHQKPPITVKGLGDDVKTKATTTALTKKQRIQQMKEGKKIANAVSGGKGLASLEALSSKLKIKKDIIGNDILECVLPHSKNFALNNLKSNPGFTLSDMVRKLFTQHCGCFLEYLGLKRPLTDQQNQQFRCGVMKPLDNLSAINGCSVRDAFHEVLDHQLAGLRTWPADRLRMFRQIYLDMLQG